jgi:cell division initiation protein
LWTLPTGCEETDMTITPLDIKQKQFKLKFRGFDIDEVDSFLEEVTDAMEALIRERETLKDELAVLGERVATYEQTEKGLRDTLVAAQKMGDDLKAAAQKDAQLKIKAAEVEADRMLQSARRELAKTHEEIAELKRIKERFAMKIRGVIADHLKMLEYDERQSGAKVE